MKYKIILFINVNLLKFDHEIEGWVGVEQNKLISIYNLHVYSNRKWEVCCYLQLDTKCIIVKNWVGTFEETLSRNLIIIKNCLKTETQASSKK